MIRIIVVDPGKEAYTMLVDETTDFVKAIVGKSAIKFRPYDDPVAIVYDPDNKGRGCPKCRAITKLYPKVFKGHYTEEERIEDFIYGRFIIIQEDDNYKPINFDNIMCRAYKALFLYPEIYKKVRGHWSIIEVHHEIKQKNKKIAI